MIYFSFAISDRMFYGKVNLNRRPLSLAQAFAVLENEEVTIACNPSHKATIKALESRHGIVVEIPEKPPVVSLSPGDFLLLFQVDGLPRLTDRHEYTEEEIRKANFSFSLWSVEK